MPRKDIVRARRDTAANWTSVNPTLLLAEFGYETDTGKFKMGDGATAWSSLAYVAGLNGADGDNAYVYIRYASDSSGTGFSSTPSASLDFIAVLSTSTEIASPVVGDFTGLWVKYQGDDGADGEPVDQAVKADIEAETNEDSYIPPDLLRHGPGVAKGWVNFDGTGVLSIQDSYNVSSVTDLGTGEYRVNWDDDMASAGYTIGGISSFEHTNHGGISQQLAGSVKVQTRNSSHALVDANNVHVFAFGEQA